MKAELESVGEKKHPCLPPLESSSVIITFSFFFFFFLSFNLLFMIVDGFFFLSFSLLSKFAEGNEYSCPTSYK